MKIVKARRVRTFSPIETTAGRRRLLARLLVLSSALAAVGAATNASAQEPPAMRVAGIASANRTHTDGVERPFFDGLAKAAGVKTQLPRPRTRRFSLARRDCGRIDFPIVRPSATVSLS